MAKEKRCTTCEEVKSIEQFSLARNGNRAIGLMNDDVRLLRKAIAYLGGL